MPKITPVISRIVFPHQTVLGFKVQPHIDLVTIPGGRSGKFTLIGENTKLVRDLRNKVDSKGIAFIEKGIPTSLARILEMSAANPEQILNLPKVDFGPGKNRFVPFGLKMAQRNIIEGNAEELMEKVRRGAPILINLAEEITASTKEITEPMVLEACRNSGYSDEDGRSMFGLFMMRLRLTSSKYTFQAFREKDVLVGTIGNSLPKSQKKGEETVSRSVYKRVVEPTGLTLPQLQDYLVNELKVRSAMLHTEGGGFPACASLLRGRRTPDPHKI
jgi:hypothetical protein